MLFSVSCERGQTTVARTEQKVFVHFSLLKSQTFVPLERGESEYIQDERIKSWARMDKPFTVMNVTAIVRSRKDRRRVSSHRLYNTQLYLISLYIYIYWRLAELWWNHVRPKNQSPETSNLFNLIFVPLYHCCALSNNATTSRTVNKGLLHKLQ